MSKYSSDISIIADTNLSSEYHVAISPNGQYIATFNAGRLGTLSVGKVGSDKSIIDISQENFKPSAKLWSLSISNPVNTVNNEIEMLIALSCFTESDMMLGDPLTTGINPSTDEKYQLRNDEEEGLPISSTLIISVSNNRIKSRNVIDELGGLVKFLNDQSSVVLIINVHGISKASFDNSWWWNTSLFYPQIQELSFPIKFQYELKKLYQNTSCLELLSRSIEDDFFLIEDYKDRVQVVEMYNLKTDNLEMVFHQRSNSVATAFGYGSPAVSISKHKSLLAYCRGANAITIYLMENSLEISTQIFPRIEKILSLDFINNDESLLIIAQEDYQDFKPLIIIWDIFSYMSNSIRVLQDSKKLFSSPNFKLIRNCGNILLVDSDEKILSILDDPIIKDTIVPNYNSNLTSIDLEVYFSEKNSIVYHIIFDQHGTQYDAENKSVIVYDKEPWIHSKKYDRISAFLDDDERTQLIIGETTVQVWYKKNQNSKEQLKYIRVVPKNTTLSLKSLEIGQREFKIKITVDEEGKEKEKKEIHWPYKVNAVKDACYALRHLYDRRDDPAGPQKQQEYENLFHKAENLVRQFIKERPAVWRLIDVRYDVMANLIQGRCISLLQQILDNEEANPLTTKHLHTPRLYEWPKKPKENSDLEISIRCIEGRKQRDAVMVGFLLDYYSNNAMDNTGWMFTVSRAIPLLFKYHLDTYAKDLFSKPIFGMKEVHLDETHINLKDLPRNKLKYIKSFDPITRLVSKDEELKVKKSIITKLMSRFTHNQFALQKVIPGLEGGDSSALLALRLVPLPDFTAYPGDVKEQELNFRRLPLQLLRIALWPRGHAVKDKPKLSPFLKVVRKDKDGIAFDNPAMEAVIDFKWESARSHFLRHILLFVVFAVSFAILTGSVKNSLVKNGVSSRNTYGDANRTFIDIITVLFYYMGYYLLASEVVQCYHEGWRRYRSVYNFFDVASIIMPLATYTVTLIRVAKGGETENQLQQLTIATSFTILILWMELFLLLRYFAVTGNFIYIIINIASNVWPFIAFMGIVVLAHGHAMYLLLRNPTAIGVEPDGTQYVIQDTGQQIQQTFDLTKATDNYFSNFVDSVIAVYFWTNGRWDQLQQWTFWPVTLLSIIASVLLVIILQNMLIAFMSGVFDEAKSEGRLAVLKYRSELIAEYEVLEKPFGDKKGNPRHIFYIGNINKLSAWSRKCEEYKKLRESSTKEKVYNYYDDDDDNDNNIDSSPSSAKVAKEWDVTGSDIDDYEQKNIKSMNKANRNEFYSSWNTSSNIDNTSISKSLPIIEDTNNIQGEIILLKDSIKDVKGTIDGRLKLLEDKLTRVLNKLDSSN